MNSLLRILSISLILLGTASASTVAQIQEDADKFIGGVTLAKDCLRKLQASIELLKNGSAANAQGQPISSDTLARDFNVYTTISNLCDEFSAPTSTQERRAEIFDQLGILASTHLCIPNTVIDQKTKQTIFENLGSKRSDAANYFIQCLIYNPETALFSLTQSRDSNPAINTYVTYAVELRPLLHIIPSAVEIDSKYSMMNQLISGFASEIQRYEWSVNQESWIQNSFEIFTTLKPDLLVISSPLYELNTQSSNALVAYYQKKKREDDAQKLTLLMNSAFSNRFKQIIDEVKLKNKSTTENLISERNVLSLIATRAAAYKNAIKKLTRNQADFAPFDETHSLYIKGLSQYKDFYEEIKRQFESMKNTDSENKRKMIADKLFIEISIRLKQAKNDDLSEEFYIQPVVTFLNSYISDEARTFANIIDETLEISFNDQWASKWDLQKARFMSIPSFHLLEEAETVMALNNEIEQIYMGLTQLIQTIAKDHTPLVSLFEALKPELKKYKKVVSEKINRLEDLVNKLAPSPKKKKRAKKKSTPAIVDSASHTLSSQNVDDAETTNEQKQIIVPDVLTSDFESTTNQQEEIGTALTSSAQISTAPALTKTQQKKLKQAAKRLNGAQITKEQSTQKPLSARITVVTELTESERTDNQLNQREREKEKKAKLRASIERQRKIEQDRENAELAALAEQKRQKECEKIKRQKMKENLVLAERGGKSIEETMQTTDTNTSVLAAPKAPFTFNPNAVEFKPETIPNETRQLVTTATAYDPDYVAWLAAQKAWQQYYATYGYYGYPICEQSVIPGYN